MSDRMLARVSRIAVAIESGVILAPLTLLAVLGVFLAIMLGSFGSMELLLFGTAPLMALLALFCCWYLALRFVRFGRGALDSVPATLWILPVLAGIACLTGLSVRFSGSAHFDEEWAGINLWLEIFVLGSPALVPLLHLSAEKWLRTNYLPESTP